VIVRVQHAYAEAQHAGNLWGVLAARLARADVPEGRLSATFGRQVHGDGSESFVYVTTWQDMESIYAWVGGRDLVATPRLFHGLERFLDGYDVQHYIAPDLDQLTEEQALQQAAPSAAGADVARRAASARVPPSPPNRVGVSH
jgi:hypothetical protein